ncbi:dynein heavy chain 7, axonemal [Trichonephila clavipes]|nr:dynein heavy chain 7, axonemal [Trichonephila clavipes]
MQNRTSTYVVFQRVMKSAGADGKGTVFLITDSQIKEECFLEDIDNLLNSGEVPNLFAVDEKQEKIETKDESTRFENPVTLESPKSGVGVHLCRRIGPCGLPDSQDHWQSPSQGHPLLRSRVGLHEKGPTVDGLVADLKAVEKDAVRPLVEKEEGADLSPLSLFSYFVKRSSENMHIIIAMSPIGNAFRIRLRQFPSLINCCTIDWFQVSDDTNPYDFQVAKLQCIGLVQKCMGTRLLDLKSGTEKKSDVMKKAQVVVTDILI